MIMTIKIQNSRLLAILSYLSQSLAKRGNVPICEDYLVEAVPNGPHTMLIVSSTDLQSTLQVRTTLIGQHVSGAFVLPSDSVKYLKKIGKNEELVIEYEAKSYGITLIAEGGKAKYSGENAGDFPKAPEGVDSHLFDLGPGIIEHINWLTYLLSKDELRPSMTGINFGLHEGDVYMCATDGHLLRTFNIMHWGKDKDVTFNEWNQSFFIMNPKTANILSGSKIDGNVSVFRKLESRTNGDGQVIDCVNVGYKFMAKVDGYLLDVDLITRNINERYPDYMAVVPTEQTICYKVDVPSLIKLLGKAELFANETNHTVIFNLQDMTLFAENLEWNKEITLNLPGTMEGGHMLIAFNAEMLKLVLDGISTASIWLSAPNKAAVFHNGNMMTLIMPQKISHEHPLMLKYLGLEASPILEDGRNNPE
jgi:DNA polymerase-3 subunit beta